MASTMTSPAHAAATTWPRPLLWGVVGARVQGERAERRDAGESVHIGVTCVLSLAAALSDPGLRCAAAVGCTRARPHACTTARASQRRTLAHAAAPSTHTHTWLPGAPTAPRSGRAGRSWWRAPPVQHQWSRRRHRRRPDRQRRPGPSRCAPRSRPALKTWRARDQSHPGGPLLAGHTRLAGGRQLGDHRSGERLCSCSYSTPEAFGRGV